MSKVLIVDDDQDIRLLLDKFLTKNGFKTATAATGDEALQITKKESPETDIMPKFSDERLL